MQRNHRVWLLLALLLTSAGAVRYWYASASLFVTRFEDERYSLQNVRKIYFTGDLEPAVGYYPSPVFNVPQVALLKASDAVFRATGDTDWHVVTRQGQFQPAAFLITRLISSFWGLVTLLMAFLIGRQLFSARVGLITALLLAFLPWTVHASGINKPDALLAACVLLAMHASLAAAATNRIGWYLWSGVAIALAMSAKLTGGVVAVPLMVFTLLTGLKSPRRIVHLAVAGITSAATFVLLNPFWWAYLYFVRSLQRDYAGRTEDGPWQIPVRLVDFHLDSYLFGPVLGTLGLIAALLLAASTARRWRRGGPSDRGRSLQLVMLLSYPLVYTVAYALQTSYFKPNNFLHVVPFTALALAWLLDAAWIRIRGRLPASARRPAAAVAVVGLLALSVPSGVLYVYRSLVPSTFDAALRSLDHRLRPANGRLVLVERWDSPRTAWEGVRRFHRGLSRVQLVDDLGQLESGQLALADGLVFQRRQGEETPALAPGPGGATETFRSEPFGLRGPDVVAVRRGWRRVEPYDLLTTEPCGDGCLQADLPDHVEAGERLTLFVKLPFGVIGDQSSVPTAVLGDQRLDLLWASRPKDGQLFVTRRVMLEHGVRQLRLIRPEPYGPGVDNIVLQLNRWMREGEASQGPESAGAS